MKTYLKFIVLLSSLILISCEEVVSIPLEESEPRLVIDASIEWFKGTEGNNQIIKISRTSSFYEENTESIEDAQVRIFSENGTEFKFLHQQDGIYINNNFQPVLNGTYELEVNLDGELYTATETLIPVTSLDYIEQLENGGFAGDEIEIKAFYTDPVSTEDYYLFEFIDEDISLEIYEDEFTNGNQIFGYYSTEDIEPDDEIEIQIQGISKSYYEFLFILRSQLGTEGGGPFETMPATVKGNIINKTNPDNYPFGYFRLSEVDSTLYIVE
ncbi:DUF4249 domain-containing protein [Christiangramia forsetii]|uniref:DUF4249 domain-containing protein n=2 Tax=Christiangramia forsetii TaxID=411153 RepID=A0LYZ7_CHRFK|nr:DUF4249 domain-containing protein [Christiangramia forsetii]GGG37024.1 hypothetical protein GCM10011532_20900 [Christiangramia forsetii]CAL65592.1 hypothetical protein GFO_0614 [Christiangramia forsetii KT0803]